ncbi:cardiolipin synthase [Prosthecobacter fusiformis]|uniref:Cardiolipin synthase n=1 Tax=Prosthecobacter fusiformis TaxID=48464 RepID=A0A4R7S6M3_9BACT|nr:phospholipase D-like domain-containing protein [Prosthecobacter fusiformis]TDU73346.1 cardiolipin synthase [Prosthecobacter fusiformis]
MFPLLKPKAKTWAKSLAHVGRNDENHSRYGWMKFAATALLSGGAAIIFSKNFLETEKRITHDIDTDYGVMDPAFERVMSHLMGPPLVGGNKVTILENGAEFFPRMLDAIRKAKHSVTLESFVFIKGKISKAFADALCEAAQRGVKVHFLQDAMGCDCIDSEFVQRMADCGVELEIFRRFNLAHFNHRTHRKLLIVDGRIGFTGGAGISDQWDGNGDKADHWRDTQYEVEGPVVSQMQQAFMDNWMQTRAQVLHGDLYFPELFPCGDKTCQMLKSSVSEGADSARLMFLLSIAAARHSIRIVNPYFVPDMLVLKLLKKARQRGVSIEIIAPSKRIDQRLVRFVGRARWGGLLREGVRFYEFQPALLHSKYFIVDEHWVSVGSCNLDDRSLCLNEEANLNILGTDFAREHLEVFEYDKAQSVEITWATWRNRPLQEKLLGHVGGIMRSQM